MVKLKFKKLDKKTEKVFKESEVLVMYENITNHIKIIAEGQMGLGERMDKIEDRMNKLETKVDNLTVETKINFKLAFDYFSRIDDEIQDIKKRLGKLEKTMAKQEDFENLKERVYNLEKEVQQYKMILRDKK